MLCRHGNTFDPGDEVVWVGAREDLPLVDRGREQARELARAFLAAEIVPAAIHTGSLARTREHAEIVGAALGSRINVDSRLDEIDYGAWSGLADAEVAARFGERVLDDWRDRGVWPQEADWKPDEARVRADVASFVRELGDVHEPGDVVIAVTSNGRLRYFLRQVEAEFERRCGERALSVRTGHACRMVLSREPRIERWNVAPDGLWDGRQ